MDTQRDKFFAAAFFGIGLGYILSPALVILIAFTCNLIMGWNMITSLIIGMIISIIMGCGYLIAAFRKLKQRGTKK